MKKVIEKWVQSWLKSIARVVINKYQPRVIAVTGSFGKTATKEAIYIALRSEVKYLRRNIGNLNGQWGMPLTIIGSKVLHGSRIAYIKALFKGVFLLVFRSRKYPKTLILEMGADKPGDIAYLLEIVKPDIAVLTGIGETHLEMFGSLEQVVREKSRLIDVLGESGVAVINYDDKKALEIGENHAGKVLTYGLSEGADIRATQIRHELNDLEHERESTDMVGGVGFGVLSGGAEFERGYLRDVVGHASVYAGLASFCVAKALQLDLSKVVQDLKENFVPTPGRMRLLRGIKYTILIDDSYNSSPRAVILSLETLANLSAQGKKIAVLGDMLELGNTSVELHEKVGSRVAELGVGLLICVGERATDIAHGAIRAGMEAEKVFEFDDSVKAGLFLQERMEKGDLILIKGSRGVEMEVVVKEVMAEPRRAGELLVK